MTENETLHPTTDLRVPERRPTATKVLPDPGIWWCEPCASLNAWPSIAKEDVADG